MGELRESHTISGPFPDVDPLDTAKLFLRTNGYSVVSEEQGPRPAALEYEPFERPGESDAASAEGEFVDGEEDEAAEGDDSDGEPEEEEAEEATGTPAEELPDEVLTALHVERGSPGSGWFSSNLAELKTELRLRLDGNRVRLDYVVNTTGQHLWDEEKAFWKKEARALEGFMVDAGRLTNVAEAEKARAGEVRRDFVMMGFWIAAVVAIVLFLVLVTLLRAA